MVWADSMSSSVGWFRSNPTTPAGNSSHLYPGTLQTYARSHSPRLRAYNGRIPGFRSMQMLDQ